MSREQYPRAVVGDRGTTDSYRRVLVIDDDPSVRHILGAALRRRALVVDEAPDGRDALALLAENRYAVVIVDLLMPDVDGFSVIDALHSGVNPPIVLVVSGAEGPVLNRVDPQKIHGVVKKPFDPVELAEIVGSCTEIRSRGAFETMAVATAVAGAPLIALLKL